MKPAKPVELWAPFVKNKDGSEWIDWTLIDRTRFGARQKYLSLWLPEDHVDSLRRVRFAKVRVIPC